MTDHKPTYAIDSAGNRRALKPGDTIRHGERLHVDVGMMDSASTTVADRARKFCDELETAGKTDAEIRRAAVARKLGDAAVAGRSDEYIRACFDTLTAVEQPSVPHQQPAQQRQQAALDSAQGARDAEHSRYVDSIQNGWRTYYTPPPAAGIADAAAVTHAASAHQAYVKSLADGWKS